MVLEHGETLPHGTTRTGRWLRARRLKLALWVAVIEGLLVAVHVISWWVAVFVAAAVIAYYFWAGRRLRSDLARQASWIAALSQALVAMVPVLVIIVGTLALIAVGVLAVVALFALLSDRS
jgi:hypothetical protein